MKPWLKSRLPSIVITVVIVALVVGGIAYAVTRESGGSDALTVNGESVSQATVNNELRALASTNIVPSSTPGAVSADVGTQWLTSRVAVVALQKLFADNDVALTPKQRAAVITQLRKQYSGLPHSAENVVIDVSVANSLLGDKLNGTAGVSAALTKAMRKLDVSVDPKYGRWDRARGQVCPITGCPKAGASTSATG